MGHLSKLLVDPSISIRSASAALSCACKGDTHANMAAAIMTWLHGRKFIFLLRTPHHDMRLYGLASLHGCWQSLFRTYAHPAKGDDQRICRCGQGIFPRRQRGEIRQCRARPHGARGAAGCVLTGDFLTFGQVFIDLHDDLGNVIDVRCHRRSVV
jgi:hypothetical protein